ncbi:MAG TPA: hypothetical protein VJB89_00960 [Candidatus Nanoarchaeia archaeon]|nr:hypothetical protein [Candidatus Nanoarchaeia archaeon]
MRKKQELIDRTWKFISRNPYVSLPACIMASASALDILDIKNPLLELYTLGLSSFLGYHLVKTVSQEKHLLERRGQHQIINWLIDHYNISALAGGVVGGLVEASKTYGERRIPNFIYGMGETTFVLSMLGRYVYESEKIKRERIELVNDIIPKGIGFLINLYLIKRGIFEARDENYFSRANLDETIQIRAPKARLFSEISHSLREGLFYYTALQASCTIGSHVIKRVFFNFRKRGAGLEEKVRIQEELVKESAGTQRVYDLIGLARLQTNETQRNEIYRTALKEIQQRKNQSHYMDMWLRRTRGLIKRFGANDIEKGIIKLTNGDIYGGVRDISKASEKEPNNLMKKYLLSKALIISGDLSGFEIRERIVKELLEREKYFLKKDSKNQVVLMQGVVLGGDLIGKIGEENSLLKEMERNDRFKHLLKNRSDLDVPESIGIFDFMDKKVYVMDLALGGEFDCRNLLRLVELASILHKGCGFFSEKREDLMEIYRRIFYIDLAAAELLFLGLLQEQNRLYGHQILDLDCHTKNFLMDETHNLIKVDNEDRGNTYVSHELANIFNDKPLKLSELEKGVEMQSRILELDKDVLSNALPISFIIRTARAFPSIRQKGDSRLNETRLRNCLMLNTNRKIRKGLEILIKCC